MKKTIKARRGLLAEDLACKHLLKLGFEIKARNWRFRRAEVDIIASDHEWLVFIEVKSRSGTLYGTPETAVTPHKEALLSDAAAAYMLEHGYTGEFRFDIVSVLFRLEEKPLIEHFVDAFFPGI